MTTEPTTELQTELTGEIRRWHAKATQCAGQAVDDLNLALEAGANCGGAIQDWLEQNKGKGLADLRDLVPYGQAKKYVKLFTIRRETGKLPTDMQVVRALPLFDPHHEDEEPAEPKQPEAPAEKLVKVVTKALAVLEAMRQAKPIAKWSRVERDAAIAQLKPLVELYQELSK